MDIIEILIKARKEREMTLKELSEKSGVSLGTVNKLFSGGIASVKVSTANKLASALGIDLETLISANEGVESKKPSCDTYGFVKCGAFTNEISVCDVDFNVNKILELINFAVKEGVKVAVFPELCITSYTSGDLVFQDALLAAANDGVMRLALQTTLKDILYFVGAPVKVKGRIYNCAIAICKGKILAVIPKTNLPNYNEFYEKRYFAPAPNGVSYIEYCNQTVPFGTNILLCNTLFPEMRVACEICEDIWVPNSPSIFHSLAGANLIVNLSASNEILGKKHYRKEIVKAHSYRCICGYIYTSSGNGESSTDTVFGGHNLICEMGNVVAESKPFSNGIAIGDVDCAYLDFERTKKFTSLDTDQEYLTVNFELDCDNFKLTRGFEKTPFVPTEPALLNETCTDALEIQVRGLLKRIRQVNCKKLVLGISGGLDSTLALIVAIKALKLAGKKSEDLVAITMPCFGTSDRTLNNARKLCSEFKCTFLEISIAESVKKHLSDIEHDGVTPDVTFENAQARERTQVLMDYANKVGGLVVGTGDLSELALGWATYNGDHMSMYSVNGGVTKTLAKAIVLHYANLSNERLKSVLYDIAETPISPELTPLENGEIKQSTENIIGPYILHDFFLYNIIKRGYTPSKVYFVACKTFEGEFTKNDIAKYFKLFVRRFFSQQFKRSCLPDGPKVDAISLSPRSNWKMPSDAVCEVWLKNLQEVLDSEET